MRSVRERPGSRLPSVVHRAPIGAPQWITRSHACTRWVTVGATVLASSLVLGCSDVPCRADELIDRFEGAAVSPLWNTWGTPPTLGVANGRAFVEIVAGGPIDQWGAFATQQQYAFQRCAVWIQVPLAFDSSVPGDTYIELSQDNDNYLYMSEEGGWLHVGAVSAGVTAPVAEVLYQPAAHQWWRFNEVGGSVQFETSSDGLEWASRGQTPTPPYLQQARFMFGAGESSATVSDQPHRAEFDNVNAPP
jgi:hypothetical protein